jgi:hypothetical protein
MSGLLGYLLHPIASPLGWFCLFGFLSHRNWGWFAAWMLSGLLPAVLYSWAAGLVARKAQREIVTTYLNELGSRYRLEELAPSPELLERFGITPSADASSSARVTDTLRMFVVRATSRKYGPGISSRCLHNPLGPTHVFLRRSPTTLDATGWFEVLHEFGHASKGGFETEVCQYAEIPAVVLSAIVLCMTFPKNRFILWFAIGFVIFRLYRWIMYVRPVEAEISADAYAIKRLASEPFGPQFAQEAANNYVSLYTDAYKSSFGLRRAEFWCRIRAMRGWAWVISIGQQQFIPDHPRAQKKFVFLLFVVAFVILSFFAGDFPSKAAGLMASIFPIAAVHIFLSRSSRERRQSEINDRIDAGLSGAHDPEGGLAMPFHNIAFRRIEEFLPAHLRVVGATSVQDIIAVVEEGDQPAMPAAGPGGRRMDLESAIKAIAAVATVAKIAYEVYQLWRKRGPAEPPGTQVSEVVLHLDEMQLRAILTDIQSRWPLTRADWPANGEEIAQKTVLDAATEVAEPAKKDVVEQSQ